MEKKKLTQKQLSALKAKYLEERQDLLHAKVDQLGVTLFDKIFDKYLSALEIEGGSLLASKSNLELINGLEKIYKNFNLQYNVPVVKQWIADVQGLTEINTTYFNGVQSKPTITAAKKAISVVNDGLGITDKGIPVKNGFVDKFIQDKTLIAKIKKQTVKSITQKKGFQEFRQELKETIQGVPKEPLSGGLQQYYRNNAYDTMMKSDRQISDVMANELGMKYAFWSGSKLPTSRPLCLHNAGKIVDAEELRKLTFEKIKKMYQSGLPNGKSGIWKPLRDLGGFGCIHRLDYISTDLAIQLKSKWIDINTLLK